MYQTYLKSGIENKMSTDPWPPNGHQDQLSRLPVPDDALLRQSKSLVELIVERINQSGGRLLSTAIWSLRCMRPAWVITAQGPRKFGESGDFITALKPPICSRVAWRGSADRFWRRWGW